MKKLIITALAVVALALPAPVAADWSWGGSGSSYDWSSGYGNCGWYDWSCY